jgi:hypothetical protein
VKIFRSYLLPALLVASTLLLAFWLVMADRSKRSFGGYDLTAREVVGFQSTIPGWTVRKVPMDLENSTDPNILGMELSRKESLPGQGPRFFVRLVHGYNMPMCMKIKYYTVEKLLDHGVRPVSYPKLQSAFRVGGQRAEGGGQTIDLRLLNTSLTTTLPVQLWRLTSSAGTVSLWATTMIRSGDFAVTPEDISSMAFPRVETPEDPNWVPRGLALEDLKHPVASFQSWWHGRWDGARWDVLTFLRLRPPAHGSEELLSYVTRSVVPDVKPENEAEVMRDLLNTHAAMLKELQKWRRNGK